MKTYLAVFTSLYLLAHCGQAQTPIANPLIDYGTFLKDARQVRSVREPRRLTEEQFLATMSEPGVVLLDARSVSKYQLRHLRGAVNLTLPDFTAADLSKIIPDKTTKVLIYCNNNFLGDQVAMTSKVAGASLNLSTFLTLTTYGYTNVYELGPLIDIKSSKLPFAGSEIAPSAE